MAGLTYGVTKKVSKAINNGFYKLGDTTPSGEKVTTSNVGALNQANAFAAQRAVAPVTARLDSAPHPDEDPTPPTVKPTGGNTTQSAQANNGMDAYGYLNDLMTSYASQRQAQLEEAYARAKSSINAGFNDASGLLASNFTEAQKAMNSSYNNSMSSLQADADKSLREAYINRILSSKNLNQQMAASGLSGGASETTMANMLNNYGNARNNINTTLNSNISDLNATRDQNLASIIQNYQSSLAQLASQRASALANIDMALANGMGNALDQQYSFQTSSGYMNALQQAMANMQNFQGAATQANNPVQAVSTEQAGIGDISSSTNKELLERMMANMIAQNQAQSPAKLTAPLTPSKTSAIAKAASNITNAQMAAAQANTTQNLLDALMSRWSA